MGAGSSTPASQASSDVANTILTKMFTQPDLLSFLTLTDKKACERIDYSSISAAVQKDLQAAGGQLRFHGPDSERVSICFDQAKGYTRAIEIFAALYPLLGDTSVKRRGVALVGGGKTRRAVRDGAVRDGTQRGGAAIARGSAGEQKIKDTSLYPLWLMKNSFYIDKTTTDMYLVILSLTDSVAGPDSKKGIYFNVSDAMIQSDDGFSVTGQVFDRTVKRDKTPCEIHIGPGEEGGYVFSIDGTVFLDFRYDKDGPGGAWSYNENIEGSKGETPLGSSRSAVLSRNLIRKMKERVGLTSAGATSYGQPASGQISYRPTGPQPSTALAGTFFRKETGNVKAALKEISEKKKNKPIALAIARALMLMRPIDPANSQGGPPTSQICSPKFTFEGRDANVPRKGVALDKTFYFKSWMNLYYDNGEYRGGEYRWSQSSVGRAQLEQAAGELSILYSNPMKPRVTPDLKFLSTPLPDFTRACLNKGESDFVIPDKVLPYIKQIVQELLTVQKKYEVLANQILAKVFVFKADGSVSFRPEILGTGGVTKLQELCVLTRNMLLAYYMQVESLFIRGIMVYEQI
jgi:hypothetical protein